MKGLRRQICWLMLVALGGPACGRFGYAPIYDPHDAAGATAVGQDAFAEGQTDGAQGSVGPEDAAGTDFLRAATRTLVDAAATGDGPRIDAPTVNDPRDAAPDAGTVPVADLGFDLAPKDGPAGPADAPGDGPPNDVAIDVPNDVPGDVPADVPPDEPAFMVSSPDLGPVLWADAGTDAGPDAGPDVGPDVGSDEAGADVGSEVEADVGADAGAEVGADAPVDVPAATPDVAVDAGADAPADTAVCATPWPPASGLLADWRAEGNTQNEVACSPWQAVSNNAVPYGLGRDGQAWQVRSTQSSRAGDPRYIGVPGAQGFVLPKMTFDVWVAETAFNAYPGSNRFIMATSFQDDFDQMGPGEAVLYLHEIQEYFFLVKVGSGFVNGDDWSSCNFQYLRDNPDRAVWHRLTGTYDGAQILCYRDGVLVGTGTLGAKQTGPVGEVVIGRNYPGDIDGARVFNRALSASEIATPWP